MLETRNAVAIKPGTLLKLDGSPSIQGQLSARKEVEGEHLAARRTASICIQLEVSLFLRP